MPIESAREADDVGNLAKILKNLATLAANRGFSYREMCEDARLRGDWTPASLKQFIHRLGDRVALTGRVERLSLVLVSYFEKEAATFPLSAEIVEQLNILKAISDRSSSSFLEEIKGDFKSVRLQAKNIHFPEKILYARYSADKSNIIKIAIDINTVRDDVTFSMKIIGVESLRRFVFGNISATSLNYYFHGFAYNVVPSLSNEEFVQIDFSDRRVRRSLLSDNPLGVEAICASNVHLFDSYFPVTFLGLNTRGSPISGSGVFINHHAWDDFHISREMLTSYRCKPDGGPISRLMQDTGATTVCPDFVRILPRDPQET